MRLDGTSQPRKATSLKIGYLSAVDMPAHEGAQAIVLKARMLTEDAMTPMIKSAFTDALREKQYEKAVEDALCQTWELQLNSALREAAEDIAKDPNIADKPAALREAMGEYITTLHAAMLGSTVSKEKQPEVKPEGTFKQQEADMAEIEELKAELAKAKQLASLSDVQKSHYNALPEAERDAFAALTADERDAVVKALSVADETFVAEDGTTVAKSKVGADLYAVMKNQNTQIAKLRDEADMTRLVKQAETELKHLPGEAVAKAKVLKSIERMPQADRDALTAMLKSGDAACATGFKPAAAAGDGSEVDANAKLDAMVTKYAAEHKVVKSVALKAVYESDEGKALLEEIQ